MRIFKIPSKEGCCCLNYCFINGSHAEPEGFKGLLHLLEHMHYRDSSSNRIVSVKRRMEEIGSIFNAYTAENCINFHTSFLPNTFNEVLSCMHDIVFRKNFNQVDVEGERSVVYREFIDNYANPSSAVTLQLLDQLYDDRFTYILGKEEDILSCTAEKLDQLYDMLFGESNLLVILTGPQDFLNQVSSDSLVPDVLNLNKVPSNMRIGQWGLRRPSFKETERGGGTCYMRRAFAFPHLEIKNKEEAYFQRVLLQVSAEMLGGSWLSPLMRILREEKGFCYGTWADSWKGTLYDAFMIGCDLNPESKGQCSIIIDNLLETFYDDKEYFYFCINKMINSRKWEEIYGRGLSQKVISKYTTDFTTPDEDYLRNVMTFERFVDTIRRLNLFDPLKFSVSIIC